MEINHARVNVQCPPGMRAGQNLRITLPRNQNAGNNSNRQAYMVTIPAGVRPREQFRVMVNGQELMVTCPDNARPGTNVRIFPPAPTDSSRRRERGGASAPRIQVRGGLWFWSCVRRRSPPLPPLLNPLLNPLLPTLIPRRSRCRCPRVFSPVNRLR